jgi:hypothetical protein
VGRLLLTISKWRNEHPANVGQQIVLIIKLFRELELFPNLYGGLSNREIEKQFGHCHKFAKKVRDQIDNNPETVFAEPAHLESPRKITDEVRRSMNL